MTFQAIRIVDLHHNNETIEIDELTATGAEMLIHECEEMLSALKDRMYAEEEE